MVTELLQSADKVITFADWSVVSLFVNLAEYNASGYCIIALSVSQEEA